MLHNHRNDNQIILNMIPKWAVQETQFMGKGVFCTHPLAHGDPILHEDVDDMIFLSQALAYADFHEVYSQQERAIEKELFAFYLAAIDQSPDRTSHPNVLKYISNLPPCFHALICWSQDELDMLDNPKLKSKIVVSRTQVLEDYYKIYFNLDQLLKDSNLIGDRLIKDASHLKRITTGRFIYFYAAITSRNVYYEDSYSNIGALSPNIEMFNHSSMPNCTVSIGSTRYTILATRDIQVGEEIFVKYGDFSDQTSLEAYGFLPEQGPLSEADSENYRVRVAALYRERKGGKEKSELEFMKAQCSKVLK